MYKVINSTVQVPLPHLKDHKYKGITIEKKGTKYAYLNLNEYEDFLSILQESKFKRHDRVFWFKNGSSKIPKEINKDTVNTNRIDKITKVKLSFDRYNTILGDDVRYETEEIFGNKKGLAYETYLIKVDDYNKINATNY